MRCLVSFVLATMVLLGCSSPGLSPREGYVEVPGGKIWYRIVGSGTRTPLLLLHGGPGAPSYYLKPLAALADERPVIFYDQLGCGHSDQPTDTTLWTIKRFVDELTALRQALNLREVHLYGHSWGAILAAEYMFTGPSGVRSVILASPALSIPRWLKDVDSLRAILPESTRITLEKQEKAGTIDSQEYQAAVMLFYQRYLARKQPWSADLDSSFAQLSQAVYMYMWGPNEFTATGTLKTYDCTNRLGDIEVPTLFTAGRYDEASPATVQYYQSLVPNSRLVILENSAHMTMQDESDRYIQVLRDFLHDTERK